MHKSQDELSQLRQDGGRKVEIGGVYRHYKSPDMMYVVKDIVIQESDNQPCVIYQALYGNKITFSRPLCVWLENVKTDTGIVPRFVRIQD